MCFSVGWFRDVGLHQDHFHGDEHWFFHFHRFDLNVRTASLLGLVGAGGVGYPISVYATNQHWSQLGAVLLGILILVFLIDALSTFIRKKLIQSE